MPIFVFLILVFCLNIFAAEQEQPTPYDLIRPIWPMVWDTAATDDGGTVESFSKFTPNRTKRNPLPAVGAMPMDFVPNGIIPDSLNQAFRDAQNLRIGRIRVNQAGYLPDDPEKHFYYISNGKCAETYSIVDLLGNEVASGGTFQSTGKTTSSTWKIVAGTDAAQNNQQRYSANATGPEGEVCEGFLSQIGGLNTNERYRIKVGNQLSSTFIISDRVYSMVRDATLKFYGINRSGNSESWFHKPSHVKDGSGSYVTGQGTGATGPDFTTPFEGALEGGWYDCGDHLKESQTQAYAFMVLAVMAASNPGRDEDNYAYNMGETINTDGIPDILREAKHGADYFLRSFRFAKGIVDNMVVSVGNFGADHGWWGRPENQDALPATLVGRGGPHERDLRLGELGSNVSGQIAAGLAILAKDYALYDKAFADSCLMVAEKMYDFAKNLELMVGEAGSASGLGPGTYDGGKPYVYNKIPAGWSSAAYNGNNEAYDDLGIAAIALHYATYEQTGDPKYLNDAVEEKSFAAEQENTAGNFRGGWFAFTRNGMRKAAKNTSWANAYAYTLYGFYKMLLRDTETAARYGISEQDRLWYAENIVYNMSENLSNRSGTGSNSITIPGRSNSFNITYGDLWYNMATDQTWIYNRYQAGNIFEVLAYADVTKDLEGVRLPQKGAQFWNSDAMKQLGLNQLNYMLGVNPWDVSFLLGVGDKNDAHPHHRASNPEGKNMPGAGYKYNPPTGALFGGVTPGVLTNDWAPSTLSWEDYHLSETCIDATAMFVASSAVAVREEDRNRAPKEINVEIRYAGYDSAIVKISQDIRGPVMLLYSTNETGPFNTPVKDTLHAVQHELHLTGLQNGTTYFFKVVAINGRSEKYTTKWLVDSTSTPFSFTTLVSEAPAADIQNIKICNLTADTAEVMWFTPNGQYESKVYWDTTLTTYDQMTWNTGNGNADVSGIPTNFHYVKIGKLQEKKTYYYCVESNGVRSCTDADGKPLKFTTPVEKRKFEVLTYQYEFTDLDFMNLNIVNGEDRAFDSLTLRLYVTAREDEILPVPGVDGQPGVCPLMIDEDICQAYDEAGFNKPCETDREIRDNLRGAQPVKLEDTYDEATGTYGWYFPINLGSTVIKSSSRMRIDLGFSSGIYQNGMCETLRSPSKKRMTASSGDWSWSPHVRDIDGADYEGMPILDKDFGDSDLPPVNPYIVVYRKDEFIVGFSPSYQEMTTKRASYEITVAYDAPFNVSSGSYIQLDSSISTMRLKGTAYITENGFVTDIWVNGQPLSREQLKDAAVYNRTTGKYDLDIPVKMAIGTNKVDVTVFAGPDPECSECMQNGGCAFSNRTYFVQFSKGDRTQSKMQLLTEANSSISSPVIEDPLNFKVFISDKDNKDREEIQIRLLNSRTGNELPVSLKRTDATLGYFESEFLHAVNQAGASLPNVDLLGGDTLTVIYVDADDEDDSTSQYFFRAPTTPIPQIASMLDSDCNDKGDMLHITFTGSEFDGARMRLDSVLVSLDSTTSYNAVNITARPANVISGTEAQIPLNEADIPETSNPKGTITVYMTEDGVQKVAEKKLSDGIAPRLVSVALLENENHANPQDTLKIAFSEPVSLASKNVWPLRITDGISEIGQESIVVKSVTTTDDGKSYQYVIEGNTEGLFVKNGYKAEIAANFPVTDLELNKLTDCNGPVTIIESVRPVPVRYAKISDLEGDGQPDEIYIEFTRALREKDMVDTVDVYWGNPEVYQAFAMPLSGWNLETIVGEKIARPITQVDSANAEVSYRINTSCATKEIADTTWVEKAIVDPLTGDTTDIVKEVASVMNKTVEDKTNCTNDTLVIVIPKLDTIGWDSIQNEATAIRITVPRGTYNHRTYGSKGGNGWVLPRRGPLGGFFDDNTATLFDKCPPILITAQDSIWESYSILKVTSSEPLQQDSSSALKYIERKRDGKAGVYLEDLLRQSNQGTRQTYYYNEENDDAVRAGDSIRLVPIPSLTRYTDIAGNTPLEGNPWIIVTGNAGNTRFKVSLENGVTVATGDVQGYGDLLPTVDEYFRISFWDENTGLIMEINEGMAMPTSKMINSDTYSALGPNFLIELTVPTALMKNENDKYISSVDIKIAMDIYDNMGQFINKQEFSLDGNMLRKYIGGDGILRVHLEWLAHDGEAPKSHSDKKIATGAFIAKFKFTATETDLTTLKKNKITDETTKVFGFKRKNMK